MGDWLATFGKFQPDLPANIGVNDFFLPVNDKSLVVSHPFPLTRSASPTHRLSLYCV